MLLVPGCAIGKKFENHSSTATIALHNNGFSELSSKDLVKCQYSSEQYCIVKMSNTHQTSDVRHRSKIYIKHKTFCQQIYQHKKTHNGGESPKT